ncbi:MAG: poly(A) polymerase [Nitrospinaceae bacterium]|nr:MAG: poly(A) polymerase [Nitrospinaceae bacterium]
MQVITTHLNADFDCLASMVAAKKLYPEAKMVFSGSAEKMVNRYLQEVNPALEISRIKEIDLDQVSLLILVDTQNPARIGVFQSLINKPGVEVHIFDHHPDAGPEVRAVKSIVKKRGAATTILTEILAENQIALTREESTLMALGIYEDTHSLISTSTTPEDFHAVAKLVESGADLNVVADYVQSRLNQEQVDVLNELIRNIEFLNINGVEIALAMVTCEEFVEDLAYVVHRVMDLENLSALLVLVRMDKRVYFIGRSRNKAVDLTQVAREFDGGGHANAASASVREMTLVQAREKLLSVLEEKVEPLCRVKDIMHFPVVSVKKSDSIHTVEKTLTLFNLNTLPVMEKKVPVGLITRQIVEKALHHKLGKTSADDLMIREFSVTAPDSYFRTIIPMVIEKKQKLIPVVDVKTGELEGVVSRGDLLRVLQGDLILDEKSGKPAGFKGRGGHKNVKSLMKERLDKKLMDLFESIAKVADGDDCSVFVVGGFVRDLLLRIPNLDVDIVVEGDGVGFARKLADLLQGRVKSHAKFGTSVIILEDGFRIDVATARMEFYKHPAALPTVEKSSIKADLFRRDFTVNSLAIQLTGKDAFSLMDYFNGEKDLKDKMIRVLHNLSFIEDPCRIFRAIRFEQRHGFQIGKQTEAFMKTAVKKRLVDKLSGSRFLNELVLILKEGNPVSCIRRMMEFSLFQFISPGMLADVSRVKVLERVGEVLSWAKMVPFVKFPEAWFIYFMGLFYDLDKSAFQLAVERLRLPMRLRKRLENDVETCREAVKRLANKKQMAPGEIYEIFSQLSAEAVIFMLTLLADDRVNNYATLYLTQYHDLGKLSLTGDDLIRMGVKPGPIFQTVFKNLRDARVDGKVKTRQDEVALVEKHFL